jgi:anti-sigma B factor antagonist
MPIRSDEYNGVCVLTVDGSLAGETAAALRRGVEDRLKQKQVADFVVDLERSGFMDSDGLESLLWLKRQAENHFGRVRLAAPDQNCQKILEITRLAHRFECHADVSAALKTMR